MPVIRSADATVFEIHGARFRSYASSATGSKQLCFWRTEIPEEVTGLPHRVSCEEVFAVIEGRVRLTLDEEAHLLEPDDVAVAPAGATVRLDNLGPGPAALWVSTGVGLEAELEDGTRMSPPWAA